ncbi:MAG TPA: hypothetical protein VMB26_11235 [Candidatus Binataceae bacterium]|nr:hypothetical protein [Candidatus Binataceae bacterium]
MTTLSDKEVIDLLDTARAQLESYIQVSQSATELRSALEVQCGPSQSWSGPIGLVIDATPNGVLV